MVTALLAERAGGPGVRFKAHRSGNDIAEGRLADVPVTLAWPRSYMNLSGRPVAALLAFYKIPPERLVVDPRRAGYPVRRGPAEARRRRQRPQRAPLHHQALGTRDYYRVRFGIGRPPGRMDAAAFVLRDFSAAERKELPLLLDRCADAAETLITKGLAEAQNIYHTDWARTVRPEWPRRGCY